MKIYINEFNQIKAVRVNDTGMDTLSEIEVEDDFLSGYCDTVIKGFCYEVVVNDDGTKTISVYPYKDLALLESLQEQYEENLILQEELTNTQLALAELYEGLEV